MIFGNILFIPCLAKVHTVRSINNSQKVMSPVDVLNFRERCALVTFDTANQAIEAHWANNFVQFGNARGAKGWYKVYYRYGGSY